MSKTGRATEPSGLVPSRPQSVAPDASGFSFARLQRSIGNRPLSALLKRGPQSASGSTGTSSHSACEADADEAATAVTGASSQPPRGAPSRTPHTLPEGLVAGISSAPGHPLPADTRSEFEGAFGVGFDAVRLHTDRKAAVLSRAIGARALTIGSSVLFGAGEYDPHSPQGRWLLSHELAHVVQQRRDRLDNGVVREAASADVVQPYLSPLDVLDYLGLGIDLVERAYLTTFYKKDDKEIQLALNLIYTTLDLIFAVTPGIGGGGVAVRASHGAFALTWHALPGSAKERLIVEVAKGTAWSIGKTTQFINMMVREGEGGGKGEDESSGQQTGKEAESTRQPEPAKEAPAPRPAPPAPVREKVRKAGLSGKEGAKDIPSWAEGKRPRVGESGRAFAKRVLDERYGKGPHDESPGSEFSKIKKFCDRAFEDPD